MSALTARRARFMRLRIALLAAMIAGGAGWVVRRAYQLQVQQAPELRAMAEEQYLKDIHLAPKRGSIYDRNGAELAVSVEVDSAYANPRRMREAGVQVRQVATTLAGLLGVDSQLIEKRLSADRHFVWLKRRLSPNESKAVRGLNIPGVLLTNEARRYYPNRELAAHVLGFADIDGQGIDGLELTLDTRLRGSAERVPAIRDRRGKVVFSEQLLDDRAAQGDDVVLTIDKTIQHVAERELELAVRTFEAKAGSVVALDPQTGEILALANFPSFNPNEPSLTSLAHRRNRAITDRFEPGSTLKPFTMAGALEAGVTVPGQRIDCENGSMRVAQYTIHDTHNWEMLTPAEILKHSSNIGIAKIGISLGRARLYRTLVDFGFGASTDIGLPGEAAGILRNYKRWYDMDAATIAFGQGMSVTALQLAVSTGALANRGRRLHPFLIKRVQNAKGEILEETIPRLELQVVPPHVAGLVTDMMTAATGEEGTGSEAAIDGYLVAGKTGTAQKADYTHGGYADGKWVSSFVGFVPARKPRLLIAVAIDEPIIAHHGGTVAAPVFRRVAAASLRHLGVMPNVRQQEPVAQEPRRKSHDKAALVSAPVAPAALPAEALAEDERRVPDLTGLHARAALTRAHAGGLSLSLEGSGVVVAQIPAPATVVKVGTDVAVTLAVPNHHTRRIDKPSPDSTTPTASSLSQAPAAVASATVGGRDG